MLDPVAEQRADTLGASRGHAGDGDRQFGMTLAQGADQRCGGDALAHRDGMHPDAAGLQRRHLEGEALGDALSVGRRLAPAQVQAQGDQWQGEVQQQGVKGAVHGGEGYQLAAILWGHPSQRNSLPGSDHQEAESWASYLAGWPASPLGGASHKDRAHSGASGGTVTAPSVILCPLFPEGSRSCPKP
ncbi:hypothetical protein D3C85_1319790 [compost metagenome]